MDLPKGFTTLEDEEFMKDFAGDYKLPIGAVMVELGCYKGRSAICWLEGLRKLGGKLITVDRHTAFEGDAKFSGMDYVENIWERKLFEDVIHIIGDFREVSRFFDMQIDALFIDGDHKFESVSKDFANWSGFVKKDGYLIFHDYVEGFHDIWKFVNQVKDLSSWKFLGVKGRCAIFKKW